MRPAVLLGWTSRLSLHYTPKVLGERSKCQMTPQPQASVSLSIGRPGHRSAPSGPASTRRKMDLNANGTEGFASCILNRPDKGVGSAIERQDQCNSTLHHPLPFNHPRLLRQRSGEPVIVAHQK